MSTPTLKMLMKQLETHHDPKLRAVIGEVEKLLAERDAWAYKYDQAIARIECLECQLNQAEHDCPIYRREVEKGIFDPVVNR